jgi:hypothetical protein
VSEFFAVEPKDGIFRTSRWRSYGDLSALVPFVCGLLAAGFAGIGPLSHCVADFIAVSFGGDCRARSAGTGSSADLCTGSPGSSDLTAIPER